MYNNDEGLAPLHIAVKANATRMVNLILSYLSKMDNTGAGVFKDIFIDLINYRGFETYLENSTFKTIQMLSK